jgi:ABC-type polysaccharide/polyol phosphate export permease
MRLMLFVTPIFWIVAQRTGLRASLADINPLYHLITIVREPLMGTLPASHHWYIGFGSMVAALTVGFFVFAIYRGRIAIWL